SLYAVKIEVPGRSPVVAGAHGGVAAIRSWDGAFSYPDDGSLATIGTISAHATSTGGGTSVQTSSEVARLSLFGGEVTADAVIGGAGATVSGKSGSSDFTGSSISNLIVLGQPVTAGPQVRVP